MSAKKPFGATSLRPTIAGRDHAVTTGHYLATFAAMKVLEGGGNAVDAGVTAALALSVLQSDIVCFAGVAPTLIYLAEKDQVISLAGLGHWPKATDVEVLRAAGDGKSVPEGILRSIIPAAPATHIKALRQFGTISFEEAASPALDLATRGFPAYPTFVNNVQQAAGKYARWDDNKRIFLPGGTSPKVGHLFVQSDLARTISGMIGAEKAARGDRDKKLQSVHDYFYSGPVAKSIDSYHRENGGFIRLDDLSEFSVPMEDAISSRYKGHEIFCCDAWCQGISMLEAFNIVSSYDVQTLQHNSAPYIHLLSEAMNLVFSDRESFIGDPRFYPVPTKELLSEEFSSQRRKLINSTQAFGRMPPAGILSRSTKPQSEPLNIAKGKKVAADPDTIYSGVVDRHGNIYSATLSDNSADSPIIPGTGLAISSRGMQSRLDPAHPSYVRPGSRPRLTPSPTIVGRGGMPFMCFGSPGGDVQIQAMLQVFLAVTDFGMSLQSAVEQPRFCTSNFPNSFAPHEYHPGRLSLESGISSEIALELRNLGHDIEIWPSFSAQVGAVCIAARDSKTGQVSACADPRREAYALAW